MAYLNPTHVSQELLIRLYAALRAKTISDWGEPSPRASLPTLWFTE